MQYSRHEDNTTVSDLLVMFLLLLGFVSFAIHDFFKKEDFRNRILDTLIIAVIMWSITVLQSTQPLMFERVILCVLILHGIRNVNTIGVLTKKRDPITEGIFLLLQTWLVFGLLNWKAQFTSIAYLPLCLIGSILVFAGTVNYFDPKRKCA